ncbi:MAG: 5-dehydro-2-deoxygluconokinase [Aestuariivirga sp.]
MLERLRLNKFLVVGRAGMDLYADPPGTQIEHALKFSAALGGSAANIAVAIARQGGKSALLTAVSDDAVGRFTLKALRAYGVDTSYIGSIGGEVRNSLAVVETRASNCQSVIYRNDAADFQVTEADAQAIDYTPFAAIIVTGTSLAREPSRSATFKAMDLAREAGLLLIIDVDYRPYSWKSKSEARRVCLMAAKKCDVIVANDEEFDVLSGSEKGLELAEQLNQKANRIVVYKMGDQGCIVFAGPMRFHTPIFGVTALKPTGAGDGFMGGLLSGLVAGEPMPDAVRRGAATAAIVVTRVGCAPAMPDTAEVLSFMKQWQA